MSHFVVLAFRRDATSRRLSSFSRASGWQQCVRLLTALALSATMVPAHAGRPLATDDAAIVDAGACQLETWNERTRDARSLWLNLGCNPFGKTEFSLGGAQVRPSGESSFTARQWQVKQMLRAHDDEQTGFALAVGGQRTRHTDARDVFVHGIATLPLAGKARVLHVNLGALRAHEDGRHRDRATWGLAYDAEVAAATRASLETYGVSGERARWQFGLRHEWLPGHVQIDASIGSRLGRWNDDRLLTVGLVFVSPPFLR
ncbi:MAG: hypothetical protein ACK4UX_08375 [Thiobacillus sp.]